jgi:hypothetical protein
MVILNSLNLDMKFTCWHRLYFSCDHTVDPQIGQRTTDQAARKRHILYRQKRYTQQMYFKANDNMKQSQCNTASKTLN